MSKQRKPRGGCPAAFFVYGDDLLASEFMSPGVVEVVLAAGSTVLGEAGLLGSPVIDRRYPDLVQCFWRGALKKRLPLRFEWCFNAPIHRGAPYGRG
ncbi:hypothetical protein HB778_02095 [Mesorhizobium huakuii]|uniref:Uncharacterized protein n=1 Tax=Mesorhizobium huakuii TaxID=28104 RepID=A0A7G6SM68_9HYPH|nr:hypothetical protein HB778_02095 [Mesorhizobium huakuii]